VRTHLEFKSSLFVGDDNGANSYNPEIDGAKLADFLCEQFGALGYDTSVIEEDWGWMISLAHDKFPLWLGSSSYGEKDGWLVFIEPSKPFVRKWFSKVDTQPTVAKVASQLEQILVNKGDATSLNWWSDHDSGRK
jgi:hypothetical protein